MGTNNLIKEFAKIVTSPKDVINNYNFLHKIEVNSNTLVEEQIPEEYKKIYSLITDIPININDIAMLELDGKVVKLPGNMYIRGDLD